MASRAETLRSRKPELVADLWLYPSEQGGRRSAIRLGWGCPCSVQKATDDCWDAYPLLGDLEMKPGESRKAVGFVFLSGEAAAAKMRAAGKFYLWEGGFIGEAGLTPIWWRGQYFVQVM
jgi:hypothetical protein